MIRTLTAWWAGAQVGELRVDDHGDLQFVYAEAWLAGPDARAISISLPKRAEPFDQRQTRPSSRAFCRTRAGEVADPLGRSDCRGGPFPRASQGLDTRSV